MQVKPFSFSGEGPSDDGRASHDESPVGPWHRISEILRHTLREELGCSATRSAAPTSSLTELASHGNHVDKLNKHCALKRLQELEGQEAFGSGANKSATLPFFLS